MSAIEIIAPGTYRVDNGRGTQLTLIKKSGHGSPHWEVQSINARTRAMHRNRNFPGVRTYGTLAEVEDHYKAFRGISKLAEQGEQQKCVTF
jgi:hypothetical protein